MCLGLVYSPSRSFSVRLLMRLACLQFAFGAVFVRWCTAFGVSPVRLRCLAGLCRCLLVCDHLFLGEFVSWMRCTAARCEPRSSVLQIVVVRFRVS